MKKFNIYILLFSFMICCSNASAKVLIDYSLNDIKGEYEGITNIISPTYFYLHIEGSRKCFLAFTTSESDRIRKTTFNIISIQKAMNKNKCTLDIPDARISLSVLSANSVELGLSFEIKQGDIKQEDIKKIPIVLMRTDFTDKLRKHITESNGSD